MKISEHLKKEYWSRRIAPGSEAPVPTNNGYYITPAPNTLNGDNFRYMTTSDFLNEIWPSAHEINSPHWIYKPVYVDEPVLDDNGSPVLEVNGKVKKRKKFVGYQNMETTRCSLQYRFAIAKANHSAQKGFWIGNETKQYKEEFATLLSWRDSMGLKTAFFEAVLSLRQCCEAAVYQYRDGNTLTYKVFSPLYGDILFPDYDENHNFVLYRLYNIKGKRVVDIYACGWMETWVEPSTADDKNSEIEITWWKRFRGWLGKGIGRLSSSISEDGWRRVGERRDSQIGNNLNQVTYFKVDDLATGIVEDEIKSWERSMSYIAESMKVCAFPDKLIKATKIKSLPTPDAHGRIFAVEGDVDQLKAADMKTVDPGDMSNIATVNINAKRQAIMHGSMSVIIEPEILKSGADSSSALRLMFTSEIQDAEACWVKIAPQVRQMVEVLKALVAKMEGSEIYTKIRTSIEPITWIPQNTAELVDNTTKLLYAGVISKENAASEVDLQYPDNMAQVAREQEEELYRKTFVPLKAKHDAEQKFGATDVANDVILTENQTDDDSSPYKPDTGETKANIDNNAARRDIANNDAIDQ